ncbi:Hypp5547 [Branchiostoma lanceolatum]|uniref:Hypp5547 protein n=1 Tax=Branchiostoma lanceolatum TaxID=7740 RepID=A0A8J9VI81_BRALA|nr:Hypp5547 [Branchiostoma lanceolatum]
MGNAASTVDRAVDFLSERVGPEFLLVRRPAMANNYLLGPMLSDGGRNSAGKTILVSHAGKTPGIRLQPQLSDYDFAGDLRKEPTLGPYITDRILHSTDTSGGVYATFFPVEFDISAGSVNYAGILFKNCRLHSIDEEHFRMRLMKKKLNQEAIGIRGKDHFFLITEAFIAESVTLAHGQRTEVSAEVGVDVDPNGAGAQAQYHSGGIQRSNIGQGTLAFRFVEVKYDMYGTITGMNLVQNPRESFVLESRNEEVKDQTRYLPRLPTFSPDSGYV